MNGFSSAELDQFARDGFVIVRGLVAGALCASMKGLARRDLVAEAPPLEYEAQVRYPGAPESLDAPGGRTVRRILQACARSEIYRDWATSPDLAVRMHQLLGSRLELSQAHHNCIMTKNPAFSSATGWHQDIRYWSFEKPELVSAWLALGPEHEENGCLWLVPGSHRMDFRVDRYDADRFFRADLEENQDVIRAKVAAELDEGDVLFFHARLLHAAGRNRTAQTKFAAVFTYHATDNRPLSGTRSASSPDLSVP
ncbi:MAG: phytanoyl-CoA dioxygenase family protein [Betaproteobacteria bacterium]